MKTVPFVLLLSLMSVCFTACNIDDVDDEKPFTEDVPEFLWTPSLAGSLIADGSVTLRWVESLVYEELFNKLDTKIMANYVDPDRFEIYQSDQPDDGFTKIAEMKNENKDVSFKVNNLQNGKTVYFRVKSFRKGYETMESGEYAFIPNPQPKSEIVLTSEQLSGEAASLPLFISPTGEKAAYTISSNNGNIMLYLCNADGTDKQLVVDDISNPPFWNQDGSLLYVVTNYRQRTQLRSYNSITGELINYYDFPLWSFSFAVSPDGNKVLYSQVLYDGNSNLYLCNLYLYDVKTGNNSLLMSRNMGNRLEEYSEQIWIDNESYMVKKYKVDTPPYDDVSLSLVSYKDNKVEDLIPEYSHHSNYAVLSPDRKHIVYMDSANDNTTRLMLYNTERKSFRQLTGYEPDIYINNGYRHLAWKDNQTVYYAEHSEANGESRIVSVSIP